MDVDPTTMSKLGPWGALLVVGYFVIRWLVNRDKESDARTQALVDKAMQRCETERAELKAEIRELRNNCGGQLKDSLEGIAGSLAILVAKRRERLAAGEDTSGAYPPVNPRASPP